MEDADSSIQSNANISMSTAQQSESVHIVKNYDSNIDKNHLEASHM